MTETKQHRGGTAAKILLPAIATIASAIASYLAKKAPEYLEQTVMPKLRETKEATGGVGDVAHDLVDRAKSVVGNDGKDEPTPTNVDLERRRRERAEHRAARRKT